MERTSASSAKMLKAPDHLVTPTFTCEVCKISVRSAQKLMDHVNFSPLHQASLGLGKNSMAGVKSRGCMRRLLYDGSKLFWRVNETLDLCIFEDPAVNCVAVRAFPQKSPQISDNGDSSSFANLIPPLKIDLRRLRHILGLEGAPKILGIHGGTCYAPVGAMSNPVLSNQSKSSEELSTTPHSSELITEYLLARLQARRDSLDRVNLFLLRLNDDDVDPVDLLLTTAETSQALPSDLAVRRRHTIDDVEEAQKEVSVATTRLKNARMKAEELSNLARTTLDNYSKHYGSAAAETKRLARNQNKASI